VLELESIGPHMNTMGNNKLQQLSAGSRYVAHAFEDAFLVSRQAELTIPERRSTHSGSERPLLAAGIFPNSIED
jgi:hypothetical protein